MAKLIEHIKSITKEEWLTYAKNIFYTLVGTIVVAIGAELFIIPSGLVTGGTSGIAIVLTSIGVPLEAELIITILTIILFTMGLVFLGWRFMLKTLISTIFYPLALYGIKFLAEGALPWLLITNSPSLASAPSLVPLLSALFGGFFVGSGCAITFLGGGSTGGVDVISFILCKYIKKLNQSRAFFMVDSIIILSGLAFRQDIALCLEGVFSAFIGAIVIDRIFLGSSQTFVANIITEKYEEITKDIIEHLDRTTSIVDVEGGYTRTSRKMLICSFSMSEYSNLMGIVARNDKKAFMTISKTHEISGEGFSYAKHNKKK